jgi:hypothetical protein
MPDIWPDLLTCCHHGCLPFCLALPAVAEGGTAIIYDWDRNTLEAIFNVPPNW